MKRNRKRWLAFLMVAALAFNEVFAMNVQAGGLQGVDEYAVESTDTDAEPAQAEDAATQESVVEAVSEEVTTEDVSEGVSPENASDIQEISIPKDTSVEKSVDAVYGPYKNVYVPTGVVGDQTMLDKIAATMPKTATVALSDGTTQTVAVSKWNAVIDEYEGSLIKATVDISSISGNSSDAAREVSIKCAYNATCKNYSAVFEPAQVKPGESYKLKTTADGTRNVRLGYLLSQDASGAYSSTLKYDSQSTSHTSPDSLSDTYSISSAATNETGEYIFLCYNKSQAADSRNAYLMGKNVTLDVRSTGNISAVYGFARKLYVPASMITADSLTKLAAILPHKACIVTDLGDTIDVDTAGAWVYNSNNGSFENTIAAVPSGITDSNNLASKTVTMSYAKSNDCSSVAVNAKPTSAKVGESTIIYITRYFSSKLGTWLCRFPDSTGGATIYDTSSSEYDQTNSDTSYAYFNLKNLTFEDSGSYYAIIADVGKEATSRYAYLSATPATLTVTGETVCSHDTLTAAFKWSSNHASSTYTLTCDSCKKVIKTGTVAATKETTPASCEETGKAIYSASVTYNGTTYKAEPYVETIPAVGHKPKADFVWSSDHESATCKVTCSTCGNTIASGTAKVSKQTTATSCDTAGSIVYTATYTYDNKEYKDTYTAIIEPGKHTPKVAFTWSDDYETCTYEITCSVCNTPLENGQAKVTKEATEPTCSSKGKKVYSASVTYEGQTYQAENKTIETPMLEHDSLVNFTWSDDYETCTYEVTCNVCNAKLQSGAATVTKKTKEATCSAEGSVVYSASVSYNGKVSKSSKTKILPMLSHTLKVDFTWSDDYETCTYKVHCDVCGKTLEEAAADVSSEVVKPSTCTVEGTKTATAMVTYNDEVYKDTKTIKLPLIAHTPAASFNWNTENKTCTYTIRCSVCEQVLATGSATVTEETSPATCTTEGQTLYTAKAEYKGKEFTDTYTKLIPTTSHKGVVTGLTWNSTHEGCSYKVICSECNQQIDQGVVTATKTVNEATCAKEGSIVYTAELTYGGQTYEAEPFTEVLPKLAHKVIVTGEKWSEDHKTCTITLGCSVCKDDNIYTETVDSDAAKIVESTCVRAGSITYVAKLEYNGGEYSATPYVENLEKLPHNYVDGEAQAATYRMEGHTAGSACSVCGQAELASNSIPSKAFTVNYNRNGATSGSMSSQTDLHYSVGGKLTKCGFQKTSYEFAGWNTKSDGTGIFLDDEADIQDEDLISIVEYYDGSVTLYAQWKKIQCNVTYVLDGGENAAANKTSYQKDELPAALENPAKKGYVFAGWYTDSAYTNQISSITDVEQDITLYARWTEKTYRITYAGNNATSGSMSEQQVNYTDKGNLNANGYERLGYLFVGWNSKMDGSGIAVADQTAVATVIEKVEAYGDDNHITLYAQWRRDAINIFYELNNGTNDASNPTEFTNEAITLKAGVRSGYSFLGWYADSAYKTKVTEITSENVNEILNEDGNISLYAKWTANKFHLKFEGNYATSGSMSDFTGTYKEGTKIPANTYKRTGYYFVGWNGSDGKFYKNEAEIAPLAVSESGQVITLRANWKLYNYKLTYVLNGGTNNVDNPSTYTYKTETFTLRYPKKRGYTFGGWYTDQACKKKITQIKKGSVGSKKLYAKWTPTKYKLTYVLNGGTNNKKNPASYTVTTTSFSFKAPTRKGYTFQGWYTDASFKTRTYQVKKGTIGNKTLYAKWSLTKYKVKYVLNGGTNNSKNPTTYTIYTSTVALKNPKRNGYRFAGWYSDSKYTKRVYQIKKGSTGNRTLYAKWIKK